MNVVCNGHLSPLQAKKALAERDTFVRIVSHCWSSTAVFHHSCWSRSRT